MAKLREKVFTSSEAGSNSLIEARSNDASHESHDEAQSWPPLPGTRRLPPLIALSYFEVAARTKSFAAAAKELNVTPAAISHQIKALEEHVGVELFVRDHRKVNPTPIAKAALPMLQNGFAALVDAVALMRAQSEAQWTIAVCAEPFFATKWLVPRLQRFYSICPEAEVHLQASLGSVDTIKREPLTDSSFRRHGLDLSVRLGHGEYPKLETQKLLDVRIIPVCSPKISEKFPFRTAQALLEQTLLGDNSSYRSSTWFGWREWFAQQGVRPPKALRVQQFGNGLLGLEAAITGQGIFLASCDLVQPEINAGKLVVAYPSEMLCPFSYHLVCPEYSLQRPIVHAFRRWLVEEAELATARPAPVSEA